MNTEKRESKMKSYQMLAVIAGERSADLKANFCKIKTKVQKHNLKHFIIYK